MDRPTGVNESTDVRAGSSGRVPRLAAVLESRGPGENTIMDLDRNGNICVITIEHARERTEIPSFSYEQVPA